MTDGKPSPAQAHGQSVFLDACTDLGIDVRTTPNGAVVSPIHRSDVPALRRAAAVAGLTLDERDRTLAFAGSTVRLECTRWLTIDAWTVAAGIVGGWQELVETAGWEPVVDEIIDGWKLSGNWPMASLTLAPTLLTASRGLTRVDELVFALESAERERVDCALTVLARDRFARAPFGQVPTTAPWMETLACLADSAQGPGTFAPSFGGFPRTLTPLVEHFAAAVLLANPQQGAQASLLESVRVQPRPARHGSFGRPVTYQ